VSERAGADGASFSFEHVGVTRDGVDLLRDVDVSLPGRGITVIVGPSGAGKSTLLRCCNRLEVPSRGVVRFHGDDVASLDPLVLRRRVAMVFQAPVVFPGTVFDNLRAGAPALATADGERLLARVGIDPEYATRAADTLSGGEAQRVVVARALATEPVVLLADEPTSALDERATGRLEHLALDLAGGGMAILWVTHDLAQARRIADHVVVLDGGRVAWSGPVGDRGTSAALDALGRDDRAGPAPESVPGGVGGAPAQAPAEEEVNDGR
jgi:putative ABC transport system ATP-binding protein